MKTAGPFLLADVNCLDFLLHHICIVFCVRLLHNFCSTMLSCNFTTLSIKRHHDIITGSTWIFFFSFENCEHLQFLCLWEICCFFSSKTVSPTAFMVHGDSFTMANEPFQKGYFSGRCSGGQKVDCFIKTRKSPRTGSHQNPSVGHEKLLFNLDSRTIIDKPNWFMCKIFVIVTQN